jgi:prepilin-type N-terminal cleavage/methylation domain-containing protein/prepilin-type processing-associated H-X9-DG protein
MTFISVVHVLPYGLKMLLFLPSEVKAIKLERRVTSFARFATFFAVQRECKGSTRESNAHRAWLTTSRDRGESSRKILSRRTAVLLSQISHAFTLIELLFVVAVLAILAFSLPVVTSATNERVSRATCVSNLRQIGTSCSIYSAENNDFLPLRSWPQSQLPWQTGEACRVNPGTGVITRGPYNFGLLFVTNGIRNPKVFYCPSTATLASNFSPEYYSTSGPWPSTPIGSGNDNVLTGYNYYPQPATLQSVAGITNKLPVLTYTTITFASPNPGDPIQGPLNEPVPLKVASVDPQKGLAVDRLGLFANLAHDNGVNVVFPDGHVRFQSTLSTPQAFNRNQWDPAIAGGPINDAISFRIIMAAWQP